MCKCLLCIFVILLHVCYFLGKILISISRFIITSASEIFVCTAQPDGSYTLNKSPDISCYSGSWFYMLPISILAYLVFGGGSALYFIYVLIRYDILIKDKGFNQRNKFILKRFKKKFFYWEAVVT